MVISNGQDEQSRGPGDSNEQPAEAIERFEFGRNWARFLSAVDDACIAEARGSIEKLLRTDSLRSVRFLDAGCGSGLMSLAAHRLGAEVTSFDVDPESLACAHALRSRFADDHAQWTITQGSLLDGRFLSTLGQFGVVYCWGVAHHTGDMWQALENLVPLVSRGGRIVLAIYNDEQYISRAWRTIKNIYQKLPRLLRPMYVVLIGGSRFAQRAAVTLLACLVRLLTFRNPLVPILNWIGQRRARGMSAWYDLVDWVGGWPFEVARPEEVFRFMRDRGFVLEEMTTSSGHGCNEFVFLRAAGQSDG